MARRSKPATPEEIARRAAKRREAEALKRAQDRDTAKHPENWGANASAIALEVNDLIEARLVGKRIYARRSPWFERVVPKEQHPASYAAMVWLLDLIAVNRGEDDKISYGPSGSGSRSLVNDRMIDAGFQLKRVRNLMHPRMGRLMFELLDPRLSTAPEASQWRLTVARFTGETMRDAQSAMVRQAALELASVREVVVYKSMA